MADVFTEIGIVASGPVLFGSVLWTEYLLDHVVAWAVGIAFRYFAINMRDDLSPGGAVWATIKAETLPMYAFQVGNCMAMTLKRVLPPTAIDNGTQRCRRPLNALLQVPLRRVKVEMTIGG